MLYYKQDIAILALGHLGVSHNITDFDTDNSNQAKIVRRHFRMSLDTVLEMHEWGFATQFGALPLVEEGPVAAYRFAYSLPTDCLVLRMIAMEGNFPTVKLYETEKQKFREVFNGVGERIIYTNIPLAHGEFTTQLSEDFAFPTHFARGVSHQLALDIAPSLITNNFPKVKQALMTTASNEVSKAIAADLGRQTLQEDSPSPFFAARLV